MFSFGLKSELHAGTFGDGHAVGMGLNLTRDHLFKEIKQIGVIK